MSPNVLPFGDKPDTPAEQAGRWIARIDAGQLGAEERQQLNDWLARDPANKRLLDEHALLWAAASQARFPAAASATVRRTPRWAWAGTAALAGTALAALLWLHPLQQDALHFQASHQTGVGQQQAWQLPDGSRTELNASSALRVAYAPERRHLELLQGVGLFEVAKDRKRPFEVMVNGTLVRAVGTRFLVQRHAGGAVEVTVYEGVVEVLRPGALAAGQPLRLGAGQVALGQQDQTRVSHASPAELERKLAWQQGRIVFDNSSLAAALEEVNRYSAEPLVLVDPSLQDLRISGAFSSRDVSVFLRSLEQGFGLKVQRQNGRWLIARG